MPVEIAICRTAHIVDNRIVVRWHVWRTSCCKRPSQPGSTEERMWTDWGWNLGSDVEACETYHVILEEVECGVRRLHAKVSSEH